MSETVVEHEQAVRLSDLAYGIVSAVEPAQVELLGEVTDRWRRRRGRMRADGASGGAVGFGLDPAVLTDLVYPLLVATFSQVLGTAMVERMRRRRWRRPVPVPDVSIVVDADQLERIHAACFAQGVSRGLTPEAARKAADAMIQVIAQRAGEPELPYGGGSAEEGDGTGDGD